jgi:uncharacterized lipoprotein YddW (UPF0748 family)
MACSGERLHTPPTGPSSVAAPAASTSDVGPAGPLNVVVDAFDYADTALLRAAWQPMEAESQAAEVAVSAEARTVARFPAPFATLKDWRVSWDRRVAIDLSGVDRLRVRLRAGDQAAVDSVMLYLRAGDGWYRLPAIPVSEAFETIEVPLSAAAIEGKPAGLHAIDRVRLSVLPSARRVTFVDVALIDAVAAGLDDIGRFGPFTSTHDAERELRRLALGRPTQKDVEARVDEAARILAQLGKHPDLRAEEPQRLSRRARRLLAEAWALVQDPRPHELRGFWGHYGDGIAGSAGRRMGWHEVIPKLSESGFNAVFPNMLWSGVAFYPSRVVPQAAAVKDQGDLLEKLVASARAHQVDVHVWKVMWQFAEGWLAPGNVTEPFRKQGRLQVDVHGKEQPWLCPAHAENQRYELAALLEAAEYDIKGIHLDYIRYKGSEVCFCEHCRRAFSAHVGHPIKAWPGDVAAGGKLESGYLDWRRARITDFVRKARAALKAKKPKLELSAAVFPRPEQAKAQVLQDWASWVNEGLLDFVCTMTYTESLPEFRASVRDQLAVTRGKIPLYVGMYSAYSAERTQALEMQIAQVLSARELGADGFVLFELQDHTLRDVLPYFAEGVTRRE